MSKTLRQFIHEGGHGTMAQLARDAGVSKQYLCDFVKGRKKTLGAEAAKRVEKASKKKIKATYLVGLTEPDVSDDEYFAALQDAA